MDEVYESFDVADFLTDDQAMIDYLNAAFQSRDPGFMQHAIGVVAKKKGMAQIAADAGVGRTSLYKSLSRDGNASFATICKVLESLGAELRVTRVN